MPALKEDEFYVGYHPAAPPGLARIQRLVVAGLAVSALALAAALVWAQSSFVPSAFEFQQYREYRGTLWARPYPMLVTGGREYLLAGEGKFGVADVARGREGQLVDLRGALIENGPHRMLELRSGSLRPAGEHGTVPALVQLGHVSLRGEIVDTKCHFGVMNPGRGKVHRDCAARCLSGGIPPGFLVRDARGMGRVLLLAGSDGRPLGREVLAFVAEPISISGELSRTANGTSILLAEPRQFRRE